MRPFVENFPFFSIFLALLAGIVTATIRSGRITYRITVAVCAASAVLNACVLWYTFQGDLSFTYTMGRFLAPYGNAIKCGPLQALLSTVFSLVMAAALAGGGYLFIRRQIWKFRWRRRRYGGRDQVYRRHVRRNNVYHIQARRRRWWRR